MTRSHFVICAFGQGKKTKSYVPGKRKLHRTTPIIDDLRSDAMYIQCSGDIRGAGFLQTIQIKEI